MKLKNLLYTLIATSMMISGIQAGGILSTMSAADSDLFTAASEGSIEKAQQALNNEARINQKCWDLDRATPLIIAASNGHSSMVEFLIEKGATKNARDSEGFSAFAWAVKKNYVTIVELFFTKLSPEEVATELEQKTYGQTLGSQLEELSDENEIAKVFSAYFDKYTENLSS